MTAPRAVPFVDGVAVLLQLLRSGLPPMRSAINAGLAPVTVLEDIPDHLSEHLPFVQVRRTTGASDQPRFYGQFWCSYQVWSDREPAMSWDPHKAAFELSQQVARTLFYAWENQTVAMNGATRLGHIAKFRISQDFRKLTDPELPHFGRYVAVYDLLIRNPRAL